MAFTPLILAGGKSTRMKSPKHLLTMPDGRPIYQHQIDLLARACPDAPSIYLSLAQDSELDSYLRTLPTITTTTTASPAAPSPPSHGNTNTNANANADANAHTHTPSSPKGERKPPTIHIITDPAPNQPSPSESTGPAAGLLAAHRALPAATWLVVACDYPFLTPAVLRRLCDAYRPPVTCFRNADGFCEPLVGVWSPEALGRLEAEAAGAAGAAGGGRGVGPSRIVRALGGREIEAGTDGDQDPNGDPDGDRAGPVLVGVNTREEWERAFEVLRSREGLRSEEGGAS